MKIQVDLHKEMCIRDRGLQLRDLTIFIFQIYIRDLSLIFSLGTYLLINLKFG